MQLLRKRNLSPVLLILALMAGVQNSSAQNSSAPSVSALSTSAPNTSVKDPSTKKPSLPNASDTGSWPRVIMGASNRDSAFILTLAKTAFQSKAPYAYCAGNDVRKKHPSLKLWFDDFGVNPLAPPSKPAIKDSDGVVTNSDAEVQQIGFDPAFFIKKEHVGNASNTFLQKQAMSGLRFVAIQKPFNWQGDNYDVLTIKSEDAPDKIFDLLSSLDVEHPPSSVYAYPYGVMWERPWLVLSQKKDHLLYIDTTHPAEFLANWDVYAADKKGTLKCVCKIAFRPDVKKAFDLLPSGPVRKMADLLDKKVIGYPAPGSEGTMNQTAALRNTVANMWADLVLRPWALGTPDASRADVDKTLQDWSKASRANAQQYKELKALYPQAQSALAAHYEQSFGKSSKEAGALAAKNMDVALRTNFRI